VAQRFDHVRDEGQKRFVFIVRRLDDDEGEAASYHLLLMLDPLIHRQQRIELSLCSGQKFPVSDSRPATFRNSDDL